MAQGCDYAWERPDPGQLKAAGYDFVCRYLSRDTTGKNLTASEAASLHAAGLSIVLNWEYAPQAALMDYAQGWQDAVDAVAQRAQVGAPADTPIYFSVDFDTTSAQLPTVLHYFQGIGQVLPASQVGVYGDASVVQAVMTANLAAYGWQTYAWSGGSWYGAAQLRQVRNDVPFNGVNIDIDESTVDSFGQWRPDGSIGGDTVPTNGFTDPAAGDALAWRGDALQGGYDVVRAGPRQGEAMWTVATLKRIEAKLDELLARPAVPATVVGGTITMSGTVTGTVTPQPNA